MSSKAVELRAQVKDMGLISDTSQDDTILQKLNLAQWQLYHSHYHWRDLETYDTLTTTELMTLDVAPSTNWAVGYTITGATSGKTCVITEVLTTKTFNVKNRSGTFTLGEILSNGTYTADQGTSYPTFTSNAHVKVPSNCAVIYDLRNTDTSPYRKLTYIPVHKFHELIPQPTAHSEGLPRYYTWWGGRIWFYPIPDTHYDLTLFYYKKPVSMKLYSTGTATYSTVTWTGTSTYWSTNSNVDTDMFIAYQADVRSDGTYPWADIATVTAVGTLTTFYTYTGGASSGAYYASSESSFSEAFDLALIYSASILLGGKVRELRELSEWLQKQYVIQLTGLVEAQASVPDYKPILEDFSPISVSGLAHAGEAYLYPFIRSDF